MSVNILPFRLYQILSEYTDCGHALPMGELRRLLRTEYGLRCERRAVYAALDKLRLAGCDIPEYREDGEGYRLLSRSLEPAEVRLLLDCSAAFSGIGERQYRDLEEKLLRGLSVHQRKACRPLSLPTGYRGLNREVLLAVEVLEEAIAARCQVTFQYLEYGMDKSSTPAENGPIRYIPTVSALPMEIII